MIADAPPKPPPLPQRMRSNVALAGRQNPPPLPARPTAGTLVSPQEQQKGVVADSAAADLGKQARNLARQLSSAQERHRRASVAAMPPAQTTTRGRDFETILACFEGLSCLRVTERTACWGRRVLGPRKLGGLLHCWDRRSSGYIKTGAQVVSRWQSSGTP